MKTILVWEAKDSSYPIKLLQHGKDSFTVQYGLQKDRNLSYANAATKLGEAIMHSAACQGCMMEDNNQWLAQCLNNMFA